MMQAWGYLREVLRFQLPLRTESFSDECQQEERSCGQHDGRTGCDAQVVREIEPYQAGE